MSRSTTYTTRTDDVYIGPRGKQIVVGDASPIACRENAQRHRSLAFRLDIPEEQRLDDLEVSGLWEDAINGPHRAHD